METTKQSRDPPSQDRLDPSGKNASAALHASAARAEAALAWRAPGLFGSFHRSARTSRAGLDPVPHLDLALERPAGLDAGDYKS